ncbi:HD domain-containing phosphohydrolase [Marinobacterium arenosum]|uniref:HD domain-containing phosphohydrolase n=1 Tax=Marinobacterium arenosum TaxID=2862496 RepID=UPI001C97DF3A|nr:HD domain-containing phosphohydrolase [Marinobacterium arenosum]MBY4676313.1 GAF domain-containing protein [Marinobacterium arenosum]
MTTRSHKDIVQQLARLALALTAEKDHRRLLSKIMQGCIELTNADAGTLYTLSGTHPDALAFTLMCNRTLGLEEPEADLAPVALFDRRGEASKLVVVQTFLQQTTVNIPDAYHCQQYDFSGTRRFDAQFHYHSKSFLCVPLKDHEGEMIGVLQLINAMDDQGQIQPFSAEQQQLVESLSSMAATALTKRKLIDSQRALLESFIKMIARAIDHKSPVTGKHCENVPAIALTLAEAVCEASDGPFGDTRFTEQQMYELKIAAWLHDCGKITTPEHIIDKGTKLETMFDRLELVAARFSQLKQHLYIELLERLPSLSDNAARQARRAYEDRCRQLDEDLAFLRTTNRGGEFLADEALARIAEIGKVGWTDSYGSSHQLLTEDEIANLSIRRGTLTDDERNIMRDHILVTIDMLEALPYPKPLANVPEIAGNHHECMDGSGYPRGLTGQQMSLRARIMCIADIFEALTSPDRPYKKGMMLSQALTIIGRMVEENKLDRELFNLFVTSGAYLRYAEQHMAAKQIDQVELNTLPGLHL